MLKRHIILVTPPSSLLKKDKHLELLYKALTKSGYNVFPFSIAKAIRFNRRAIWHIHWIDLFHIGKIRRLRMKNHSAIISSIRLIYFLIQVFTCKLFGVRILWTIHNVTSHERPHSKFEKIVTKLLLIFSNRVTALNNYIKDRMVECYGFSDICLMRQGLYEGFPVNSVTRHEARHRLGLAEKDFVLLFIGVVEEYKGIDVAIESLNEFSGNSVKLIIAGRLDRNSAYGSRVYELAMKNSNILLFDKFVAENEMQIYFRAADYTIYPYRRIANSGPLFLTLAFGVPTIIRGVGGIPEIIAINPKVAIEIAQSESGEIARAIRKARATKVEEVEFNVFRERLCWENLDDEILQVFDSLQEDGAKLKSAPGKQCNVK